MYIPSGTYRVQLNSSYTFDQLQTLVDYLHKLGISTVYAAPITTAMKGSTHGYDVCNPDLLNGEIGTEEQLEKLNKKLSAHNMGWIQDIVPNHMAFLCNNERLYDVLERGPQSPYYRYFDINWNHFDPVYKGKVMVPFIGKDFNEAVDNNEIQLQYDDSGFSIAYFNDRYPVAIESLPFIFSLIDDSDLLHSFQTLRSKISIDKKEWKTAKEEWLKTIAEYNERIQETVSKFNADKALLKQFLDEQHYILTWYKVTKSEINFRRFFTVNQLLCLRMEEEFVFTDYHQFILRLYKNDWIQGLRIDHIDGLYHPQQYVQRLRETFGEDCYIIAEKILEYNEDIARDWNMQGTSGYEFLSFTNQLLTDKDGSEKLLAFYKELVPQTQPYEDIVFDKKHTFLLTQMGGELDNLFHFVEELNLFPATSYDAKKLKDALGVLMASFPVYRIYPDRYPLHEEALPIVKKAFNTAERKTANTQELNLLKTVFYTDGTERNDANKLFFLMRLMQFTGPLAAKGVEDTTFYVYNPLISHNEVGDSPSQLGITAKEFHDKMISRQRNNPYSLNATSTHDTKRGEDARMRINALAAMPDEWIQHVNNWRQMNTPFITLVNNKPAPTTNDEYFIYQSLIGAFPEDLQVTDGFRDRTFAFLEKALREAKVETNYSEPNNEYEATCKDFVASLLNNTKPFLQSFIPFLEKVIETATLYSLAQTIIKITAPGIPDIYQGCELWDISYVDPDNRRAIDYDCRKQNLDEIIALEEKGADAVLSFIHQYKKEGREKLFATYKTLNLRRTYNDVFTEGDYIPLETSDTKVMAYARQKDNRWVLVVIPFTNEVMCDQHITILLLQASTTNWTNIFTGNELQSNDRLTLTEELKKFPVAVLTAEIK